MTNQLKWIISFLAPSPKTTLWSIPWIAGGLTIALSQKHPDQSLLIAIVAMAISSIIFNRLLHRWYRRVHIIKLGLAEFEAAIQMELKRYEQ